MTDDLVRIARDLHAGRPQDFVGRRDELAKQARSDGGRALAAAVKKLKRPSAAAWVLNAIARHAADRLEDLDDLRAQLHAAEAAVDGVAMRQLGRDGRALSGQIIVRGRELADEAGVTVSAAALAEARETLRAMTVDDGIAAAVRTEVMVAAVTTTGLEPADLTGVVAVPSLVPDAPQPPEQADDGASATVTDLSAARSRREQREARRAEEERRRAEAQRERELTKAREHHRTLRLAAKEAEEAHAAAAARVEKAEAAARQAQDALDEARTAEHDAEVAVGRRRAEAEELRTEVERLSAPGPDN